MRKGFERYIRKTEDPARLPTFRTSLSKDRRVQWVSEVIQKTEHFMEISTSIPPQHQLALQESGKQTGRR